MSDRLLQMYDGYGWGVLDRSGNCSTQKATSGVRHWLHGVIQRYNVTSVLDVACGSFGWMQLIPWGALKVKYVGVDIVRKEIEQLQREHAGDPWVSFYHADAVVGYELAHRVPGVISRSFDLVFMRQAIQHLCLRDASRVLGNILRLRSKLVVVTSYCNTTYNLGIDNGEWFPYNLEIEPFNMPRPPTERLAMQPQAVVITVTDGGNNWPESSYKEKFDESLRMLRESTPGVLSALVDTSGCEDATSTILVDDLAVVATVAATATAVAATVSSSAAAAVAAGAAAAAVAGAAAGAGAVVLGAVALRRIGRIGGRMGDMGGETLRPAPPAPAAPAPPALRESLARVRPPLAGIADALDRFEQDLLGQEGALPAGLGVEGALALVVYTTEDEPREQSVYYRLNHALRRRRHRCRQQQHQKQPAEAVGDRGERSEGDEAEAEAEESSWLGYAWQLAEAMRALPVVRGEVYRGVCCPLDAAAYAPGSRVFWNGFTSTSRSRAVASDFAASAAPATLFEVRVERGRDVGCLNQYGEAEVLLEPGSAFDVDAVAREGPLLVVRMHESRSSGPAPTWPRWQRPSVRTVQSQVGALGAIQATVAEVANEVRGLGAAVARGGAAGGGWGWLTTLLVLGLGGACAYLAVLLHKERRSKKLF
eukprot:m51a1_g7138 hypothetical protein (651) ;mRNA; r:281040-285946